MSDPLSLPDPAVPSSPGPGSARVAPRWSVGHVPGEIGVWVFVLGDMLVFAVFFCVFLVARADEPAVFARSRAELNQTFGFVNTLLLLTSSLLVVLALRAARREARPLAARLIAGAGLCALGFAVVKGLEYGGKLHHGLTPATNDFFMYFFVFTGVHFAHLLLGACVLAYLWRVVRRPVPGEHEMRTLETGASFWHMVDLLWVVLFPLLYLAS